MRRLNRSMNKAAKQIGQSFIHAINDCAEAFNEFDLPLDNK